MTPAPLHAILCWADATAVYVELPMTTGGYHRMAFPLSEGGLGRALALLRSRPAPTTRVTAPKSPPPLREAAQRALRSLALV